MPNLMKRRRVRRDELRLMVERISDKWMTAHPIVKEMTVDDCKEFILDYGVCECGCERDFYLLVEFDHVVPNALLYEGDEIKWQALRPDCHKRKTADDVARIAKAKSQGGETGQQARRRRNGPKLKTRQGFQKPPPGHKHRWGKRKLQSRNDLKRRD